MLTFKRELFPFAAVYLGLTLTFSTVSVNIVIYILYAHFKGDKEVPAWIDNGVRKFGRFTRREKRDQNKVKPSTKEEHCDDKKLTAILENEENNNEEHKPITYREYSDILNSFFFVLYMAAMIILTIIFLLPLLINYLTNG